MWAPFCRGRRGVVGPGAAGVGAVPLGGDRVVAEGLSDDRGGCLQDELAQGGGAGGLDRDSEGADLLAQAAGVQGLAGATAGEQPAAVRVRRGGHVVPVGRGGQQESGEGLGHRDGRVAEPEEDLVAVAGDVASYNTSPASCLTADGPGNSSGTASINTSFTGCPSQ